MFPDGHCGYSTNPRKSAVNRVGPIAAGRNVNDSLSEMKQGTSGRFCCCDRLRVRAIEIEVTYCPNTS